MAIANGNLRGQRLYRDVNKRIREVGIGFGVEGPAHFLCECGQDDCTSTLELTLAQFDGLLDDPGRVLLAAEHRGSLNGQRVIAEYDNFVVVAAG